MKKTIESIVRIFIYLTFFAPLVLVPSSFIFPFIVPKILLFRSLVLLMSGGYILLLLINWREYRPRLTPLNLVLTTFMVSFALSTFIGVDAYHSFWDNHERMLGLFTILHFIAYYFIGGAVFKNWKDWRLAMKIFLIAGSIVMFLCFFQKFDHNFLLNQGSGRTASTLGNAIYVGGYGLFLFFVSLLLFAREKSVYWRWAEAMLGLLAIAGMFLSGTRGSMLGLMAGMGLLVVWYLFVLPAGHKARRILAGLILLGVVSLGLMYIYRQTTFVRGIPVIGPLMNITFQGGTTATRMIAWKIAIEGWKERPIFGWGPNNFFYAFNKYYNPRSLEFGYGETWFDNAHNIILNTLTVQGIFGLIVYLSIFGVGIGGLIIARKKAGANRHLVVIGGAFLAAHLVQNVTVFENPTSYLYFMFWLAMLNRLTTDSYAAVAAADANSAKITGPADRKIGLVSVGVVGAAVGFLIFVFNVQPARANMKTLAAMGALGTDPALGIKAVQEALAFNSPHIDDIRSDLARAAMDIISAYGQALGKERSNEIIDIVYSPLRENLVLHPLDIRNHLNLAQLVQSKAMLNNAPLLLSEVENYLETARQLSPRRQQILFNLAGLKMQIGKSGEALKLLEQTISDDPNIAEGYWRLAYMYHFLGQAQRARETLSVMEERNLSVDERGSQIMRMIMATPTPTKAAK